MGHSSRSAKAHNPIRKKVAKQKNKGPILRKILRKRPKEQEIANNLESEREPILSYPAIGARRTAIELVDEVAARLQTLNEVKTIKKIGIIFSAAQESDTSTRRLALDLPNARKPIARMKKRHPHSISRFITTITMPIEEGEAFVLACSFATLFVELADEDTRQPGTRARTDQPSPCASYRPEMPDVVRENPTPEDKGGIALKRAWLGGLRGHHRAQPHADPVDPAALFQRLWASGRYTCPRSPIDVRRDTAQPEDAAWQQAMTPLFAKIEVHRDAHRTRQDQLKGLRDSLNAEDL